MTREGQVREAITRALGADPGEIRFRPTAGGCINQAATFQALGRSCFVKWNDRPLDGQFSAEAAGLDALRQSGTSLVVPEVLTFEDDGPGRSFLVLENLPQGRRTSGFEEALGHGLAELHRQSSDRGFGFPVDGYCGATPQPNGWLESWVDFYRERRLLHQLELARRNGLDSADCARLERLLTRLDDLLGADEAPALIHGDLWSGNLHVAQDGRPGLIDPAAYFANREAELGMMVLFGGFGKRVFDAYQDAFPLREGWRERLGLYTLYHVLNHFNLFGGGYGTQAMAIVRQYV